MTEILIGVVLGIIVWVLILDLVFGYSESKTRKQFHLIILNLKTMSQELDALKAEVGTATTLLTTFTTDLEAEKAKNATLQVELDAKNAELTQANTDIANVTSELKAAVDAATPHA
jgi:septal ring factor EnvC (AmiA/AmiB activator)